MKSFAIYIEIYHNLLPELFKFGISKPFLFQRKKPRYSVLNQSKIYDM